MAAGLPAGLRRAVRDAACVQRVAAKRVAVLSTARSKTCHAKAHAHTHAARTRFSAGVISSLVFFFSFLLLLPHALSSAAACRGNANATQASAGSEFCVSALPNKACTIRRQRGRCHACERTYLRCGSRLALRSFCARGGGGVRFRAVLGALLPHFVLALLLLAVRRRLLLALRRLGLLLALLSSHETRRASVDEFARQGLENGRDARYKNKGAEMVHGTWYTTGQAAVGGKMHRRLVPLSSRRTGGGRWRCRRTAPPARRSSLARQG